MPLERNKTDTTTEICVDVPVQKSQGLVTRNIFLYDLENFVPLRRSTLMVLDKRSHELMKESYEWKLIEGIFLPVAVHGERQTSEGSGDSEVDDVEQYDWRLEWLSVNAGIPSDLAINPQILNDTERLLKMLTPETSLSKTGKPRE